MRLEKPATVGIYESNGQKYFRVQIPKRLGVELLGLSIDRPRQKVQWKVMGRQVIVEKQKK